MEKLGSKNMNFMTINIAKARLNRLSILNGKNGGGTPSSRRGSVRRPHDKGFSPKILQIIRRMKFRLRLYMSMKKAKENIEEETEKAKPGYKFLVKILQNHYRSNESVQRVLEYIKVLPFFSRFLVLLGDVDDKALLELCKHAKYEHIPAGHYIFKEGEKTDNKYYVLLKGSVSVIKQKDTNVFYKDRLVRLKAIDEQKTPEDIRWESLIAGLGVKIKDLTDGEGFGERALTETDSKRSASMLTTANCDFMIILRENYLEIANKFNNKKNAKKDFMKKNIPFLGLLNSMAILEGLQYFVKEIDYPKEAAVTLENRPGNCIYFIHSGECTIEKSFLVDLKKGKSDYGSVEIKKILSTIGPGNCFGEEIITNNNKNYKYTVKVKSSSASFYYVEKAPFLMKFPPECIRLIQEGFEAKEKMHNARAEELVKGYCESFSQSPSRSSMKSSDIFKMLSPQYRTKIAKKIYVNQKRTLNSISQNSNSKESFVSPNLDEVKETSLRVHMENKEFKFNGSSDRLEKITLLQDSEQTLAPTRIPGHLDLRVTHTSSQSRIKSRRQVDRFLTPEVRSFESTPKTKVTLDPMNRTSRDFMSSRGLVALTPTSATNKVDYVKCAQILHKNERGQSTRLDSRTIREISPLPANFPEKFDFGSSPSTLERIPRAPRSLSRSPTTLNTSSGSRFSPSSPFSRLTMPDFADAESKNQFATIIERVRAEKSPPESFSRLINIMLKKKLLVDKSKLKKTRSKNMILIKSIARPITMSKSSGGDDSPANIHNSTQQKNNDFVSEFKETYRYAHLQGSTNMSISETSKVNETSREIEEKIREMSKEGINDYPKSSTHGSLISSFKAKALPKLKEKEILKPKVHRFE